MTVEGSYGAQGFRNIAYLLVEGGGVMVPLAALGICPRLLVPLERVTFLKLLGLQIDSSLYIVLSIRQLITRTKMPSVKI